MASRIDNQTPTKGGETRSNFFKLSNQYMYILANPYLNNICIQLSFLSLKCKFSNAVKFKRLVEIPAFRGENLLLNSSTTS